MALPPSDRFRVESRHRAVPDPRAGCYGVVSVLFGGAGIPLGGHLSDALRREGDVVKRQAMLFAALVVGILALLAVGGASAKKPALSATPVFKLSLKPS
jgi:hypothetical protein